jgi:hypothetical protein
LTGLATAAKTKRRITMKTTQTLENDNLTKAGERAFQEVFEKIKRETLPLDLKRPAVQERIRKMQARKKEAEKQAESDAQE